MKSYTHGGNIYTASKDKKIYDFSANINPLGVPRSVIEAAAKSLETCFNYPDPMCMELIKKLAIYENIKEENLVCGNGAADLIFRMVLALKPKCGLVNAPTFSEYENALRMVGSKVYYNYLKEEEDFKMSRAFIEKMDEIDNLDMIFICNPNNPIGNLTERSLLIDILDKAKKKNVMVIVDECFIGFTRMEDEYSLKKFLDKYPNLIIMKAFTKNFAMAGFRLGYIMSSNIEVLDKVFACGQPWSVSTPAQAGGIAALDEKEYFNKALDMINQERIRLCNCLKEIGLKVFEPTANYIFFKTFKLDGKYLCDKMKEKGILIRNCGNYPGLNDNYLRIAVRNPNENDYFIKTIKEVYHG